ncbi:hypothetical protein Leryth_004532 [Lithospermum erythrorhizon]|nr:hypothetical protein Leryth_004532 [Lithospermum erythrorhizon]
MGCSTSKLDDMPAVALCRERCRLLEEAIHHRFAFSEAHIGYLHSLNSVGVSLHRFFEQLQDSLLLVDVPHAHHQEPPPPQPSTEAMHQLDDDDIGDSYDGDDDVLFLHGHSGLDSQFCHHAQLLDHVPYGYAHHGENMGYGFGGVGGGGSYVHVNSGGGEGGGGGSYVHVNYMKNQVTPSVLYQQKPLNPKIVHMGESSCYYKNPSSYYNDSLGGFNGSSQNVIPYGGPSLMEVGPSSEGPNTKPLPLPPSPPRASFWEFLNPFESFEKYYPTYPSRGDYRELREEEGIPDLELEEEEGYVHNEVVKEVHGDQKFVNVESGAAVDEHGKGIDVDAMQATRPSPSMDIDPIEHEMHMVDKKVVNNEKRAGDDVNVARGAFKDNVDVMKEIQVQFEHAAESGYDLAVILEVGKLPYNRKHSAYQVSSKMLDAIAPALPSSGSVQVEKADCASLDVDEELGLRSKTLSSTLHKLYLWEKKLYEEVKVEEKMRVLHGRKSKKLKHLDEEGADFNKVDPTGTLVRSLSTKLKFTIQVVDKISVNINKLRDDDLWPLLNETIQEFSRMWNSMLESHRNQCRAIIEAKSLDVIASLKHFSDAHLEATLQLEHELLNWILRFCCWVSTQKEFIRALDNWLMKCLLYVPEETADGIVSFSPSRMGAPPVFGVFHQWSQSLDRVSEKEVLDHMTDFAANVLQLWDRDKLEMCQRMTNYKDMERRVKNLDKEDQKIRKEIQALDKRMVSLFGDDGGFAVTRRVFYQSDATKEGSLQVGLQRIFEAMEKFSGNSLKVYEELLQRIEDETRAGNKVS